MHPGKRAYALFIFVVIGLATLAAKPHTLLSAQAASPSTAISQSTPAEFRIPPSPAVNQWSRRTYTPSSDGRVLVRDSSSGAAIADIVVAGHAVDVAVNPTTDLVYALSSSGIVSIIDGATNRVATTIPVGQSGLAIGINTITSRLYVGTIGGLVVIDGATRQIVASLPAVFGNPDILVNEATNRIYASSIDEDRVNVIDGFTNALIAVVPVGDRPAGLAVDVLTNRIYVANSGTAAKGPGTGDTVSVIDGYRNAPVGTLRVDREGVVGVAMADTANVLSVTMANGSPVLIDLSASARVATPSTTVDAPVSTTEALSAPALQSAAIASAPNAMQATSLPGAGAYNIRVATDASPDLTDVQSLVSSATSLWTTPREKVWALFYWSHILKRQSGPIVLHGFEVTDPVRNFADFGFTMCSTVTGINQSLYELIGLRHQYWDICNHTVSAVEYDGAFHMIDSSMSNLVTLDDGVTLASVVEAAADSARLLRQRSLYSTSPEGYLTGSDTMRNLPNLINPVTGAVQSGFYKAFCETGLKYRDYYYNWDRGHRYVLNLREDESYTRYFSQLDTTADYWVSSEKVGAGNPADTFENDATNRFGLRGNGKWSFVPDLSSTGWTRAVYGSSNIAPASAGGLGPAAAGTTAEVVYKVQAANAITSQHMQAQFLRSDAAATATVSISINHGITWTAVGTAGTALGNVPLAIDLRNEVNAAYETLVRIQMVTTAAAPDGISLVGLAIDTITQVNAKALPHLNVGRNEIYIGAGDQSDTMVLWPDLRNTLWQKDVYDSSNIAAQSIPMPRTYTAAVYPSVLTSDAYLTYRLEAPTDITRLVYGGRLYNFGAGSYIDFLHSFDGGATWTRSYRLSDVSKPYDVVHYETVTNVPAGVRTVLFKYLFHNTGPNVSHATGLYSARMEVGHQPAVATMAPIDVTFRWLEVQANRSTVARSHKQVVSEFPFTYVINVGGADHPIMTSLTTSVDAAGDGSPSGYSDGVDVGGTKYLYRKRADGTNLAVNKPFTISRAPSGFKSSAPGTNTTILTDGVVGSPVTGDFSYWQAQCWAANTPVDLQVDLGSPQSVGAVRAHIFGYPGWDALKGQVLDVVEVLTSLDGVTFASQGFLPMSLWKKDVPINYMLQDDEKATAWNFELDLPTATAARFVRYHVSPKRTLCTSELQVLDHVDYTPFDIKIAPPADVEPPPVNVPPTVSLTAPAADAQYTAPASIQLKANASDSGGGIQQVDFFAGSTFIGTDTTAPYSVTWPNVAAGSYTLTARALDTDGAMTSSAGVNVTVNPLATGLPSPWVTQDIGAVGKTGSASFTSGTGTFSVTGAGADIWGTADAFRYVYQPLSGDGQIVARVATVQNTNAWVKAGVMIRTDLSAGSAQAMMMVTPGKGNNFQRRPTAGGASVGTAGLMVTAPYWVKLTRVANLVTAYQSIDGTTWSQVGTQTIVMPASVLVGLAVSSHSTATLATATFDQVAIGSAPPPVNDPPTVALTAPAPEAQYTALASIQLTADASDSDGGIQQVDFFAGSTPIGSATATPFTVTWTNVAAGSYTLTARALDTGGATTTSSGLHVTVNPPATGLPSPWLTQDVGAVGKTGTASYASGTGTFSVTGAGADIWGAADAFRYVYQSLNGDGQIVARVATVQNTNAWVKAGVMIRTDLSAGSAQAMMMVTPGKGNNFQRRPTAGGASVSTTGAMVVAPYWVKLTRSGNTVGAYQSSDGSTWSQVGSATIAMPANVLVGLAVSSHSASTLATATFDNVVTGALSGLAALPPPWITQDIGAVGRAGAASVDTATLKYTVSGAGADIWGAADAFRYLYQPFTGDGEIVTRVVSVQNTNAWVKAGVMIRADLTPGSAHAMMMVTPGKGNNFQRRPTAGGVSVSTTGLMVTAPYWVKLTRAGTTVTAYQSADGVAWSLVGADTINLPASVLIGLAVSSHSPSTVAIAQFDQVTIGP